VDVLEAIKGRRSVRKYKKLPISEEQGTQILEAGRRGPSRGNSQPWKFITRKNDKIDCLITGLEGSGLMSPKVRSLTKATRAKAPSYKLNLSLFRNNERGSNE